MDNHGQPTNWPRQVLALWIGTGGSRGIGPLLDSVQNSPGSVIFTGGDFFSTEDAYKRLGSDIKKELNLKRVPWSRWAGVIICPSALPLTCPYCAVVPISRHECHPIESREKEQTRSTVLQFWERLRKLRAHSIYELWEDQMLVGLA